MLDFHGLGLNFALKLYALFITEGKLTMQNAEMKKVHIYSSTSS